MALVRLFHQGSIVFKRQTQQPAGMLSVVAIAAVALLFSLPGCETRQSYEQRQQMRGGGREITYYGDGVVSPAEADRTAQQSRVLYYHPDGTPLYQMRSNETYTGEQNLDPFRNRQTIYSDTYGRPTVSQPTRDGVTDGTVTYYDSDGTVQRTETYRQGQRTSP